MNSPTTVSQPTIVRKIALYATALLIVVGLSLAAAEIVLRAQGFKPFQDPDVSLQVEPGGTIVQKHPTLGYARIPGRFKVTLPTGYSFVMTTLPNTLRITRPLESYEVPSTQDEIWIFGCSYTEGWTINDDETYAWLLNERFPEFDVVNFGMGGYGTLHSLMQFREALKTKTPKVAVLAYANFHDDRNTFSRVHRAAVARWNELGPLRHPYARFDSDGKLQYGYADVVYTEFPLIRQSALTYLLETTYNRFDSRRLRGHDVSEALIAEMASLAMEHGVKFIIANIDGRSRMRDFAEKNGIPHVDISVDPRIPENTNLPHDGHPSAIANRKYADTLENFLRAELAK